MSLWHANLDANALNAGANVTVFSAHSVVRVVTADQVSIETTGGDRMSALVLDRSGGHLTLAFPDGRSASLTLTSDESLSRPVPGRQFSQQDWTIN